MFDSFVFLPLSTRAYFKGRAYIKIILKNHARSYFAGRSYYQGNTVKTLQQVRIPPNTKYSYRNEKRKVHFTRAIYSISLASDAIR